MRLDEILLAPGERAQTIADCMEFVNSEIARRGAMIKLAYRTLLRFDPAFTRKAIEELIGPMLVAIDPIYQRGRRDAAGDLHRALVSEAPALADALLSVTDARATSIETPLIGRVYRRLRPRARREILKSLPRALPLLERRMPSQFE